jgi:hypothetical protein
MNRPGTRDFDPGLRSTIELLYGPDSASLGSIRGRTVRGRAPYSADEAIRAATRDLVARLADDLDSIGRDRPECNRVHSPSSPTCPNLTCKEWIDKVVSWHVERFGPRHVDVTFGAALWVTSGHRLNLGISDQSWRDLFEPTTVALDVGLNRAWITAQLGVHATATKADLHVLVDRLWPEIERVREASRSKASPHSRLGRFDRPARASYWRLRQFQGLSLTAILEEWARLTKEWAESPRAAVARTRVDYPAWTEWRRAAGGRIEAFDEVGTIQRAIGKLRRLTA